MKYAGLGGSSVPAAVTRDSTTSASPCSGRTGAPSTRRSSVRWYDPPVDKRLFTDGCVLPGVEIRLAEDGEILSRGPDLCIGLHRSRADRPQFDEDGWYHTGDIGVLDDDGYLTITDRKADFIIRGGENISALEVEEVLLAHARSRRSRGGRRPRRPPG